MEDESGFEVWSFEVDDAGAPEGELGLLGLLVEEGDGEEGGVGCEGGVAQAVRAKQARA